MRNIRNILIIAYVIAAVVAAYLITVYAIPASGQTSGATLALNGALIILVLLTVPYLILKGLFHRAHSQDSDEKEITLSDLPKDQDDIAAETGNDLPPVFEDGQPRRNDNAA